MKKLMLLSVLTVLTAFNAHADTSALLGKWGMSFTNNGFKFHITFNIQDDQTLVTNVCVHGKSTLSVSSTVATEFDDSIYTIKEAAHNSVSGPGNESCEIGTEMGQVAYQVKGNALVMKYLNDPSKPPFTLIREK